MTRGDQAKIAAFVLIVAAIPLYLTVPWAHEQLERFFSNARAQVFGQVLVAILLEAFPFVLIGAILSGVIEVLVPAEAIARLVPRRMWARLAVAPLLGVIFPVCECGVVPVVRRLIRKGLPMEMAAAYLLAGPIVNPTVVASTVLAFAGRREMWAMPVARVATGVLVAAMVGLAIARWVRPAAPASSQVEAFGHSGGGVWHALVHILHHMTRDFLLLGGYLLFGAILAAGVQSFVPRTILVSVAERPLLPGLARPGLATCGMMVLAFALNLCSEADAFVAASFTQFGFAAKLAFLAFGPMLDVKLVVMYLGALPKRVLLAVVLLVPVPVLVLSELAGWLFEATR